MKFRRPENEEDRLDMTPMIDMVFQLLIFFLVTTTFAQSAGIEVDLPRAKTKEVKRQKENILIAITQDGRIVYDGEAVSEGDLESRLQKAVKEDPDALLVIQADTNVFHGKVVEVMDLAKTVGIKHLGIATLEE